MKRKIFCLLLLIATAGFFYHQYEYAGPYDTLLRQEKSSSEEVLKHLKKWRYHNYVWFEIVPDALTTLFKRLGVGGFTETGQRVCVEGCPYWTEMWTDGFYSIDLELHKIEFLNEKRTVTFESPHYFDIETWGAIRRDLKKKGPLPQVGQKMRICGPLRVDRPYHVYTLQPDSAEDYQTIGACSVIPKSLQGLLLLIHEKTCDQIRNLDLFSQIGILDALSDAERLPDFTQAIEKMVGCVDPKVLEALKTNPEVYEALVKIAPSVQNKLPTPELNTEREDWPIRNTIHDLLENWFGIK